MTDTRYFSFLRAINTGGRRLTNDELLAPFRDLGLASVAAYQAAGNITFRAERAPDVAELEAAMQEAYGFNAPVMLRTGAALRAVASTEPFTAEQIRPTEGRVQVALLRDRPAETTVAELDDLVPEDDRVAVVDRELFWLPRAGISTSALPLTAIERLLGTMTIRTHGTLVRFSARFPD